MQASGAYADEMPPQSGVIAMASEPVSVKTTSIKGKIIGRTASTGQAIYLNDEIKTSATAKAQILLKDQSVFSIGPNSTMVIDKFVYDPQKSSLNVSIQKGAFKFVSGKIANSSDEAMKVSLPNATIAVRGTGVAGIVEPNGSATVMLLHGAVDVTSLANNSTSTLSKSGWGVQINPAGVISPPAPLPVDISRNIMQTSKTSQTTPTTASNASSNTPSVSSASTTSTAATNANTGTSSGGNTSSASTGGSSNSVTNAAVLSTPEVTSTISNSVNPISIAATTNNSVTSVATSSGVTSTSTSTALASGSSGSFSTTAASTNLASGNSQLTAANTYLATAQTQSSNAVAQASSAATQATTAAGQATIAAAQATLAAHPSFSAPELVIRYNESASTAASSAASASTAASSYSTQATTSATSAAQASTASTQAATLAVNFASTAAQQANAVVSATTSPQDVTTASSLVTQAGTLTTQANTTSTAATLANTQAASAATAAQTSASQAISSSLAAASSALSAYNSAQTVAQTLTPYETISSGTTGLGPLGNVTFSISNYAMSCWSNCAGASATINSHTFVFNFLNSTVTNNYNISFNNFNGYSGTVSGSNAATAINWSGTVNGSPYPNVVSLPVSGQTSTVGSNVYALMDTVLTSVGTSGVTKRANLATVYTSLFSGGTNGVGATSQMGVGSGYKILGK